MVIKFCKIVLKLGNPFYNHALWTTTHEAMCLRVHYEHWTCHGWIFKNTFLTYYYFFMYFHDSFWADLWTLGHRYQIWRECSDVRGERSIICKYIYYNDRLLPSGGESFPFVPEGVSMHGGGVDKIHRKMWTWKKWKNQMRTWKKNVTYICIIMQLIDLLIFL